MASADGERMSHGWRRRGLPAKMVKCQKDSECVLVRLTGHSTVYAPWLTCHPVCVKQGQSRVPGVEENLWRAVRVRAKGGGPAAWGSV